MTKSVGAAVITKNHENFIDECVDSLLAQELKLDHIVICDDASLDDTFGKLQKYQKYEQISIYRNSSSLGPSLNSNKALSLVNTDFVIYTSGDDISDAKRSKVQTEYLNNTNYDCVINDVTYLFQHPEIDDHLVPNFQSTEAVGLQLFRELFWKQNFLNASAACFRGNIKFQDLFDGGVLHLQDYDLWLKLSFSNKILSKPDKLLRYRISNSSLSQQVNQRAADKQLMIKELFSILYSNLSELSVSEINHTFQEFLIRYSKQILEIGDSNKYKNYFIYFLILSHNNDELRTYALYHLQKTGIIVEFGQFVKDYFRVDRISTMELR